MEVLIVAAIPVLFLLAGICILLISQIAGFLQFQQYYRRQRYSRAVVGTYVGQIEAADALLWERAQELEKLAQRLSASNDELTNLGNMKSKFFSMVVHDMRNPLAAILGFASMLKDKAEKPDSREMATRVHSSARFMQTVIADLTDIAIVEAGKMRVEPALQDLRPLLADLAGRYGVLARQKGIRFLYAPAPAPLRVRLDAARFGRVVTNLLDNALKFTPALGTIELSLRAEGHAAVIRVKDSGAGIHPAERQKIFQKYYQSPHIDEQTRKKGWGLGLSIASEIVRLHKATMGVESAGLGKGSTFWVKMPLAAPASEEFLV